MLSDEEKMEALLEELEVTPAELGRLIGRLPADLYKVRAGQRSLSAGLKMRLHEMAGISLEWLNTGEGPMLVRPSSKRNNVELNTDEKRLIRFLRQNPEYWDVVKAMMKAGG